jgi:hypothetical protein
MQRFPSQQKLLIIEIERVPATIPTAIKEGNRLSGMVKLLLGEGTNFYLFESRSKSEPSSPRDM